MSPEGDWEGEHGKAESLARWLNWLGLGDCACRFAWKPLGRLDGVGMGHGWVRMNTVADCPQHGASRTSRKRQSEMSDENENVIRKLCSATYDEPKRADRSDTHSCDLTEGHDGPHHCELCDSYWVARVGVVPGPHPEREQVALARMDAHLVGSGFVMVTRDESGRYLYERVDPTRIALGAPSGDGDGSGGEGEDAALEEAVRRTAARSMAAIRIGEKLRLMIRRAEMRQDKMRGWIPTGPLRDLLEGTEEALPKTAPKKGARERGQERGGQ